MVRIPVAEPTVQTNIAPMPQLAGDGWGAPGRATVQLGQAIASLGDAFGSLGAGMDAEAAKEADFNDKMEMLKFSNKVDLDLVKSQQEYNGDGTGYSLERSSLYQNDADELATRISPRGQQKAALFVETKRGPVLESAARFEGQRRQGAMIGSIEEAIGGEFGKLTEADQATFDQQFDTARRGVDAIIDSAPLPDTAKEALRAKAAALAEAQLINVGKDDPKAALQALPRAERFIQIYGGEEQPASAEGVKGLPGSPSGEAAEKPQSFKIEDPPFARRASVGRERPADSIKGFVVHETQGSDTPAGNMSWSNKKNTGANYYIDKQGKVYGWAPDTVAMNHAGVGRGVKGDLRPDLGNNNTLSLEIMTKPGEKPNDVQIKAAHALILAKSKEYGFKPEDVEAHGRLAPGHKEATEGTDVVDYVRKNWNGTAVAGLSQEAPSGAKVSGGIKPTLTAYSPQKSGDKMEGGYAAARPGPDGKAEVRTLADYKAGTSKYVTLAGDKSEFGKTYIIPEITYKDASGKTVTLQNVKGVVHDTGSAFKGKGDQRFDIPVDKDIPSKSLGSQPFSKQQIAFIPEGEFQADQPTPVAQRGLTQYAGLSKVGLSDVEPQGGARATNTIPGPSNDNAQTGKLVQVADASGRTVPQVAGSVQQLPSARPGKTSVASHLRDNLIKRLPAYRKQYEGVVGNMVGAVEKAAAEGYTLPDDLMAETEAAVGNVGTPEMTMRLAKAIEGAKFTKKIQQLPPDQIAAVAGDMRAQMLKTGATPEMIARVEATEKLHTTVNAELEKNAITWGVRVGVIPEVEPITLDTLTPEVLQQRAVAAATVAQHFGRDVQFFAPDERTTMEGVVKQGGDKMLGMLGMFYETFGDQSPIAIAEIAPKNPEAVRAAYLMATGGDQGAARDIAATMARRADPNYKADTSIGERSAVQSDFKAVVGDFYKNFPQEEKDATMRAAEAIYMARVDDPSTYDPELFRQSIDAAMGAKVNPKGIKFGGVVQTKPGRLWGTNGDPVLLPSNVRQDTFREMLDSVTVADMAEAGHPMPLDATGKPISLTRAMNARMVTVGRGKYALSLGDPDVPGGQKWVAMAAPVPDGLAVESVPMQRFELDIEKLVPILRKKNPEMFYSE